jgi:MOSC domain-containing protein YiiM
MQVLSVNVGKPRELPWNGITISTSIYKRAVAGEVAVGKLNLDGDQQADLTVHGGPYKAVYAYPAEHYGFWRDEFPDMPLTWGYFGENLTTTGLREDDVCIGDTIKIGSAKFQVTQPRLPCDKLGIRFGRDDIIKRFLASRRSGFYLSVIEEGSLRSTAEIEIVERNPQKVSIVDIINLFLGMPQDDEILARAVQVDALPQDWKLELQARSRARSKAPAQPETVTPEAEANEAPDVDAKSE